MTEAFLFDVSIVCHGIKIFKVVELVEFDDANDDNNDVLVVSEKPLQQRGEKMYLREKS